MSTETQLAAIKAAYAEGVAEITYKGRTIKYRSLNEMKRIMDDLERQLGTSKPNTIAITTDRGY